MRSLAAIEFARMTLQFVEADVRLPVSVPERDFIFVAVEAESAILVCLLGTVWWV